MSFLHPFQLRNPHIPLAVGAGPVLVACPDVAVMGFFPHAASLPNTGGFRRLGPIDRRVFEYFFRSTGNYLPPHDMTSVEDLERFVTARFEYRGILLMHDLHVTFTNAGQPVDVSFCGVSRTDAVGFTLNQQLLHGPPHLDEPNPGSHQYSKRFTGPPIPGKEPPHDWQPEDDVATLGWVTASRRRVSAKFGGGRVVIQHWQYFALSGWRGNVAPYPWIIFTYDVDVRGAFSAFVETSHIPSHYAYVADVPGGAWSFHSRRDMATTRLADLKAFVSPKSFRKRAPSGARWRLL